ncbi:CRISPR-associated protein, TIGR03985 family [Porphyromonadaceae bacterium KH3CP3RA]|nr:CRISPR-associated protein, TIGR03985 family [Porphyromonadaceae bacterium KH3CP3RA]
MYIWFLVEGVLNTHKQEMSSYSENMIQPLLQSINKKTVLRIIYFSDYKKEVSERTIEPVGIFFSKTNWYLIAYCQTREKYRTFKVDRIRALEASDITFTTPHPPLKDFLHEVRKTDGLEEVVISIPTDKISMVNDDKYYYGWFAEREVGDNTELSFLTFSLDKFARWYLSFADVATIESPDRLKEKTLQILQHISI